MWRLIPTREVSVLLQQGHRHLKVVLSELCRGKSSVKLTLRRRSFLSQEPIASLAHPALSDRRLVGRSRIQVHVHAFIRGCGQTGRDLFYRWRGGGASVAMANTPAVTVVF